MATDAQLSANRANAKKSTGPRTVDGKIRASRNAVRHALSAGYAVLRIEAPDELQRLTEDAIDHYQPTDNEEMFAVERIALAKLALLRAARLEAGMFTAALNDSLNDNNVTPFVSLDRRLHTDYDMREQIRNYTLADGIDRMARRDNAWPLFLRYQAQAERQHRRAVEAYYDLVKRRQPISPNEPNFDPDPVDSTEPAPPENEPDPAPAPAPIPPDSPDPIEPPIPDPPPDKIEVSPKQIT